MISEFGSTLQSGVAPSKDEALIRGRNARRVLGEEVPGGLVGQAERRVGRKNLRRVSV